MFCCDVSYLQNDSKYTFAFSRTSGLKLKFCCIVSKVIINLTYSGFIFARSTLWPVRGYIDGKLSLYTTLYDLYPNTQRCNYEAKKVALHRGPSILKAQNPLNKF